VAVAVLVIFQPELRRMLAQLGNLAGLPDQPRTARKTSRLLSRPFERLSDVRIGALMAIEQNLQLQNRSSQHPG